MRLDMALVIGWSSATRLGCVTTLLSDL